MIRSSSPSSAQNPALEAWLIKSWVNKIYTTSNDNMIFYNGNINKSQCNYDVSTSSSLLSC